MAIIMIIGIASIMAIAIAVIMVLVLFFSSFSSFSSSASSSASCFSVTSLRSFFLSFPSSLGPYCTLFPEPRAPVKKAGLAFSVFSASSSTTPFHL
jgi:hypothetical protein